VLFRSI